MRKNSTLFALLKTLSVCVLVASCQKWPGSLDGIQRQCGVDFVPDSGTVYQLTDNNGQVLNRDSLSRARWLDTAGNYHDIKLSTQSCMSVPEKDGQLELSSQKPKLVFIGQTSEALKRGFAPIRLEPQKELAVIWNCPAEGLIASRELDKPVRLDIADQKHLGYYKTQWQLENAGQALQLSGKSFGLTATGDDMKLDLRQVPSGRYDLVLRVSRLTEAWNDLASAYEERRCKLEVIHEAPRLPANLPGNLNITVNALIPLEKVEGAELYSCVEPRLAPSAESGCKAPAKACTRAEAFQSTPKLIMEQPGFHRLYLEWRDKAGNRSEIFCVEAAVDQNPPDLEIAWKIPSWNLPLASMPAPLRYFEATITALKDDTTEEAYLEGQLECRVEFVSAQRAVAPAEGTFCRSPRCEKQRLDQWRPCDRKFSWYTSEDWERIRNGTINLLVRTRDRVGRSAEKKLSVWAIDSGFRWYGTRGLSWLHKTLGIAGVELAQQLEKRGGIQSVSQSQDGTLWLALRQDLDEPPLLVSVSGGSHRVIDSGNSNLPANAMITDVFVDSKDRLWLGLKGQAGLALFKPESQSFVFYQDTDTGEGLTTNEYPMGFVEDAAGHLWFVSNQKTLVRFDGQRWNKTQFPEVLIGPVLDDKGEVWVALAASGGRLYHMVNHLPVLVEVSALADPKRLISAFNWDEKSNKLIIASKDNDNVKAEIGHWDGQYTPIEGTGPGEPFLEILGMKDKSYLAGANRRGFSLFDNINGQRSYSTANQVFDKEDSGSGLAPWRYFRRLRNGEIWYMMRSYSPRLKSNAYVLDFTSARPSVQFTKPNSGMMGSYVQSFLQDSQGRYWVGSVFGVSLFQGDRWKIFDKFSNPIPYIYGYRIFEDSNKQIWFSLVSTRRPITHGTLARLQGDKILPVPIPGIPNIVARGFASLADGRILVAGDKAGLLVLETAGETVKAEVLAVPGSVYDVVIDRQGRMYATGSAGVYTSTDIKSPWTLMESFEPGSAAPSNKNFDRLYLDRSGAVWGIKVRGKAYQLQTGVWRDVTALGIPLPDKSDLQAMAFDSKGQIWFDGTRHVYRWDGTVFKTLEKQSTRYFDFIPPGQPNNIWISDIMVDSYDRVFTGAFGEEPGFEIITD